MVAHEGLAQSQAGGEVAHAALGVAQRKGEPEPIGVGLSTTIVVAEVNARQDRGVNTTFASPGSFQRNPASYQ